MMTQQFKMLAKYVLMVVIPTILLIFGTLSAKGDSTEMNPTPSPTPVSTDPRGHSPASVSTQSGSNAPGYCPSDGGDIEYENIKRIRLRSNSTSDSMTLLVWIYIENPTNCEAGEPCPDYDNSPEYVNVWIDWNGNKIWEPAEQVLDEDLIGLENINYEGDMAFGLIFTPPPFAINGSTWLRANLGWGHDPNDPCETSWKWGDVLDQRVRVHVVQPQIKSITAQGIGTINNEPETGSIVELKADIDLPLNYKITKCTWTGVSGEKIEEEIQENGCSYKYLARADPDSSVTPYGEKDVTLTVTYKHLPSGASGQTSANHTYKVFFQRDGDDNQNRIPNWFEYWGKDGAVSGLDAPDVKFDPTLGSGTFGKYDSLSDLIKLGARAAKDDPITPRISENPPICPGGQFGGHQGIDTTAVTIVHERRHKEIYHKWDIGGPWHGQTDSDDETPNDKTDRWRKADNLPDSYEIDKSKTSINHVDSCNLGVIFSEPSYRLYGDEEFVARKAEFGVSGNDANDWANPGKQTLIPFSPFQILPEQENEPMPKGGAIGPETMYIQTSASSANPSNVKFTTFGSLTGQYSDTGVDTDNDSFYDSLKLSTQVEVNEQTIYNLVAWLEDQSGTPIAWASTQETLSVGTHTVNLFFDGLIIEDSGLDGPYNIARVELRAGAEEFLVDSSSNAYTTAPYQYTAFDPLAIKFAESFSDTGIDTDGDSLYDLLRIGVELNVQEAGDYKIIGELKGSDAIAVASQTASLATGSQTVDLDFNGTYIFQHRQDGPYHLRALRVEDKNGNQIDFIYEAYTTGPYNYSQFQHGETVIDASSYSDQGMDVDNDGDYDYLHIAFQIDVAQEGIYQLLATLEDSEGQRITGLTQEVALFTGRNTIDLDFPGGAIYEYGANGPYRIVSIAFLDEEGSIVDSQPVAHITQAYNYTEFSPPLINLTGNYQDYGEDTDSDGLYDYLNIDISLVPGDAGVIIAQGLLVDSTGQEIGWAENSTQMDEDTTQTITLSFSGDAIFGNGKNGPFELRNLFVYHSGDPEQAIIIPHAYTTAAYNYLDFAESSENARNVYLPFIIKN